ncbi:hypothetical protein MKZ24_08460 [Paenibacillus sp. FSL R7-0297]|uniref:hypothetical protein n=1 Tax=Paenibacillus sp. FSL R7-0297 TaxID=2921680 RepID=UPI0030F8D059
MSRMSLHAIAKEIEKEYFNKSECGEVLLSYKTVERRFKQFIQSFNIDITFLKDEKNAIYLSQTESVFVKGILTESIDKNGFLYKLLYTDEITDLNPATFEDLSGFMNNMYQHMNGKISDTDRDFYMVDLNRNLSYSALLECHQMHALIDALFANTNPMLYSQQVYLLSEFRKKLEKDFAHSIVTITLQTTELAEYIKDYKIVTGEKHMNYGDELESDTAKEYRQRDRDVLMFLEQNPLIKEHIETKLNMTIEEILQ